MTSIWSRAPNTSTSPLVCADSRKHRGHQHSSLAVDLDYLAVIAGAHQKLALRRVVLGMLASLSSISPQTFIG